MKIFGKEEKMKKRTQKFLTAVLTAAMLTSTQGGGGMSENTEVSAADKTSQNSSGKTIKIDGNTANKNTQTAYSPVLLSLSQGY